MRGEGRKICMSTALKLERPNVETTHNGSTRLLQVSTAQSPPIPTTLSEHLKKLRLQIACAKSGLSTCKKINKQTNKLTKISMKDLCPRKIQKVP